MRLRVRQSGPLRGAITVPGDKSVSHRALIVGALAQGETVVRGFSGGDDNRRTAAALRALGVAIEERDTDVRIAGVGLDGFRPPATTLDCGNSGTSMRLLCGLLAGQPFSTTLDGDASLRRRPMGRVAEPLARMGGRVQGTSRRGGLYAPLEVLGVSMGERLTGIDFAPTVASAQVKSAVLLAGLRARGITRIAEPSESRDHTERLLAWLGLPLTRRPGPTPVVELDGDSVSDFPARPLVVPGDLSSAAFLLCAAALVSGSRVRISGVGVNPTRTGILDVLAAMGVGVERQGERQEAGEPVADLEVHGGEVGATRVAGALTVRAIDELPMIATLATAATGITEIADAAELRVKESDRIATVAHELRRLGAEVEELPDGMRINGPARLRGTRCQSHGDHRVAMALCVAGLVASGETVVEEADCIVTSYPGFAEALGAMGADVSVE